MSTIAERLSEVKLRISAAAEATGRDPQDVRLLAVSKLMPSQCIREAYAAGQRDFGENYVQELVRKASELSDLPDLRLHLIGHLQTNKVKVLPGCVSMIQAVSSVRLVDELAKRFKSIPIAPAKCWPIPGVWVGAQTSRQGGASALPVLVEVNVGGEAQKSGCAPEEVASILDAIDRCDDLCAHGLMTVPPFSDDPKLARPYFDKLRRLRDDLGGAVRLPELSMGMTLDLEEAVAAGATIVRVGTAIFGDRPPREGT
jgi:uncharacterized pyridoxal phosphate-containing UPF0001 family protein